VNSIASLDAIIHRTSNGQNNEKHYLYYICAVFDVNTGVLENNKIGFVNPHQPQNE